MELHHNKQHINSNEGLLPQANRRSHYHTYFSYNPFSQTIFTNSFPENSKMKLITSIICSHTLFWTASSLAFPAKEIVGGTDAAAGAYPFVVSLEDPPFQFCGGSILASGRILTAAHCVEGYVRTEGTTLKAYAGSNDRTTHEFSSDILFTSVHMHPDYDRITQDYDIAILELETPFVLSDTIQSIGLVGAGEQPESGTEAT